MIDNIFIKCKVVILIYMFKHVNLLSLKLMI
jgi:hypothetical protein